MPTGPLRTIEALDDEGEAAVVVHLDCGHRRHVRHHPPLSVHPWVLDPAARAARRGTQIECGRCEALELPAEAEVYRRTDTFDEHTIPAGLRRDHRTKARTWGRIVVEHGALRYRVYDRDLEVRPGQPGIIPPQIPHHVEPDGPVTFHVEFLRVART